MILYVLRYYPTLSETFVYREIEELVRRGVPVVVAALGDRPDGRLQDELPPVDVLRPPKGAAPVFALRPSELPDLRWLAGHGRLKDAVRAAWIVRRAAALGVRRVHAHFAGEAAEVARVVARSLGVPYSVTVHAVDLFRPRPALPLVLREAQPVITIARHHERVLADRYGVGSVVVRIGVDPARYGPVEPEAEAVASGPLRLVTVARYAAKKGVDDLAALVDDLAGEVHLRLVCDAEHLRSAHVTPGALPPSRIPAALRAADVFVLPCRIAEDGDRDGIPVALLEAMASGLPVITTAVSGIPELVDDEVGWLVPADDPEALRAAVRAASDPNERARRGEAGRRRILDRGLTVERQVDLLLASWGGP